MVQTASFDYHLPPELIAQEPAEPRDASRLMILHRATGKIEHRIFRELPDILPRDTFLVRNNTLVFKARLFGKFSPKEVRASEILLLKKTGQAMWQAMVSPGRKFFPGKVITLIPHAEVRSQKSEVSPESEPRKSGYSNTDHRPPPARPKQSEGGITHHSLLLATVVSITADGTRILRFNHEIEPYLDAYGHVPLPPYIQKEASLQRYQTVYAKVEGSVAAPTAGLHFTSSVLKALETKGIQSAEVTLHVGRGTFEPVKASDIEDHVMHHEIYQLSEETARTINEAKAAGKKILAVGTTSVRTLETCAEENGEVKAQAGHTNLFITPGYQFKVVDMLLTNFHLPKSTLLMLVSAFAGKDLIFEAYQEAIREKYRFFSFGDAMLIV